MLLRLLRCVTFNAFCAMRCVVFVFRNALRSYISPVTHRVLRLARCETFNALCTVRFARWIDCVSLNALRNIHCICLVSAYLYLTYCFNLLLKRCFVRAYFVLHNALFALLCSQYVVCIVSCFKYVTFVALRFVLCSSHNALNAFCENCYVK